MNKKELRREVLKKRASLLPEEREQAARVIAEKLLSLEILQTPKLIFSFHHFGTELPSEVINDLLRARGHRICYPVTFPKRRMEAYLPKDPKAMRPDSYGIPSPNPEEDLWVDPKDLDLILVPLVAFDDEGRRLGYGGGYYDNFLPRSQAQKIGIALEVQRVPDVPTEEHDLTLAQIITEK